MPRPTSRVLALLGILQAGGTRTVADLADRLGVDQRTIRRYAEHLRELEIPVEAIRGRYGGYRLAAHAQMPPLMLTDEEAVATVWALLEAAEVGPGPAGPLAAMTALAKIRRVLPKSLAAGVGAVIDAVAFVPTATGQESQGNDAARPASDVDAVRVLLQLAGAARDLHPVQFEHPPVMDASHSGRCTLTASLPTAAGSTSPALTWVEQRRDHSGLIVSRGCGYQGTGFSLLTTSIQSVRFSAH